MAPPQLAAQLAASRAEVRRVEAARQADRAAAAAAAVAARQELTMAAAEMDEMRGQMAAEISWARDQALGVGGFHGAQGSRLWLRLAGWQKA